MVAMPESDTLDGLPAQGGPERVTAMEAFVAWTGNRSLATIGTNAGSPSIPFQSWKKFKEAFAPELILEAIDASPIPVRTLFDPFGGSGTTALAAQFLGIRPLTAEVNPYLADLITAKLTTYDLSAVREDFSRLMDAVITGNRGRDQQRFLPPTFVEPGVRDRYLFNADIAETIEHLLSCIDGVASPVHSRLFRIILSGVLLEFCNARVSGKGRRYRSNWRSRNVTPAGLLGAYASHGEKVLADLAKFNDRACGEFDVLLGDSRELDFTDRQVDLVVFSPPYPNSFDYTDVYNIELWMLGYLSEWSDNSALRSSTLASHVQAPRVFDPAPSGSETLRSALSGLQAVRESLWDRRIPEMIGGYFADLCTVIQRSIDILTPGGQVWMVVGDSRYSSVDVRVAQILTELMIDRGLELVENRPFRSMRASPQQGGRAELAETLIVVKKPR